MANIELAEYARCGKVGTASPDCNGTSTSAKDEEFVVLDGTLARRARDHNICDAQRPDGRLAVGQGGVAVPLPLLLAPRGWLSVVDDFYHGS